MPESIAIIMVLVFFLTMIRVYIDWSGFEKRVRQSKHVNSTDVQTTAVKIGIVSIISGVALSLLAVTVRLASSWQAVENVEPMLYLLYIISCSTGWMLLIVISFVLKAISLKSLHKGNHL
jgi:hypothetical protein